MLDKSFKRICDGIKKDVKDTQLEIMVNDNDNDNDNTNLVNIYYRIGKAFYNEYKDDNEFVHLGAKLPWKHNITLM